MGMWVRLGVSPLVDEDPPVEWIFRGGRKSADSIFRVLLVECEGQGVRFAVCLIGS